MEQIIILAATVCVFIFGIIGIVDGFYYHLWKFKLHTHPETRFEHWVHTIRAAAFLALLFLFFLADYGGTLFLVGVGIVVLDAIVLLIDLIAEGDSRKKLGGLPHKEYIVHVVANTFHFISVTLIIVSKPLQAWSLNAPQSIDRHFPEVTQLVAQNLIPGTAMLVLGHLMLMNKKVANIFESLQQRFTGACC